MKKLRTARSSRRHRSGAYIGMPGYATMMACLKRPRTSAAVARMTGVNAANAKVLLKQFHAMRLIHRVGWHQPTRGFDQPIYLIGDGIDVPARLTRSGKPMPHADHQPRLIQRVVAFASFMQALQGEAPMSRKDLEREAGLTHTAVDRLLKRLLSPEVRLAFVAAHDIRADNAGPPTALYSFGIDQDDAPKPERTARRIRDRVRRDVKKGSWTQTVFSLKRQAGIQQPRDYSQPMEAL